MGKITLGKRQRNDSTRSTTVNNKRASGVMSPIIPSNVGELALDSEIDFFFSESNTTDIHSVFSAFKVPAVPRKLSVVEEDTVDSGLGSLDNLSSDVSSSAHFDCSPNSDSTSLAEDICRDPNTVLFQLLHESEDDDSLLTGEPLTKMPRMSLLDGSKVSTLDSMESVWSSDYCSTKTVNGTTTSHEEQSILSNRVQRMSDLDTSKTIVTPTLDDKKDPSAELANLQAVLRSFIRDSTDQKTNIDADMLLTDVTTDRNVPPQKSTKFVNGTEKVTCKIQPAVMKSADKADSLNSLLSARNGAKRVPAKGLTLWSALSSRSRNGSIELKIMSQPEEQHRARYLTEGSRGAVKDRSGSGFPTVKLCGYNAPATLQVFIGTDQGKVQPHLFYQASKVCGKNSTPCTQRKIDGTTVLEIALTPDKDMTASCDCVGILKERNVDVEHRLTHFGGTKAGKKRSTRCRIVFRVTVTSSNGVTETLQVASDPILCTQPPGVPEICKKSLSECTVDGGEELFIIGKNFPKDSKVIFREVQQEQDTTHVVWEKVVEPDKEYLHPTHLICRVPSYKCRDLVRPVSVQLLVDSGGKNSEPHCFTYKPLQIAQEQKCMDLGNNLSVKTMVPSISPQPGDLNKSPMMSTLIPLHGNATPASLEVPVSPAQQQGSNLVSAVLIPTTSTAFVTPSSMHLPGATSITIIPGQLDGCSVTQSDRAASNLSSGPQEMHVPPPTTSAVKQESSMSQILGDLETLIEASNRSAQRSNANSNPSLMGFSLPPPDYPPRNGNGLSSMSDGTNDNLFSSQWPERHLQFMNNMVMQDVPVSVAVPNPSRGGVLKVKQDPTIEENLCSLSNGISDPSLQCFLPSRLLSGGVPSSVNGLGDRVSHSEYSQGHRDILNPVSVSQEYTSLSSYMKEYDGFLQKGVDRGAEQGSLLANAP